MKITSQASPTKGRGLWPVCILALVLVLIFWRSFTSGYVHFSNDGPLGQQMAGWLQLPGAFTGGWVDLNDIGSNAGTFPLDLNALIRWSLGPVGYAKFLAPTALFILGLGAWTFFRQLKLTPLAAVLGALAAMLNSVFLSSACWGVASQQIGIGMDFFALALIMSSDARTPGPLRWARWALAGLCVGVNVMEASDIGAIFSLFIAAFVFIKSLADSEGSMGVKIGRGIARVAVVAIFAAFIAAQTIVSLVSTQIQGVAGMEANKESDAAHWDWATQWSLPKAETIGLFVPGVFGYKMDTPNNMPEIWQDSYRGGQYWGGMGRSPEIDRFFDSGKDGPAPSGPNLIMRFTGGQNYAGITVALLAAWAIAQSFRRKDQSGFTPSQQKYIWFWALVLAGSVVLAWGRFDPFGLYAHTIYKLPFFSSIRNPAKFVLIFSWAISILCAYGVHDLSRRYLNPAAPIGDLSAWWSRVAGFDRKWTLATLGVVGASLLGWMIYSSEKPALITYLNKVGYGDQETAQQIADFSVSQVAWFAGILIAIVGLVILIIAGVFAGQRSKLAGYLLGGVLVFDLCRADLPFAVYWDYVQKYEVGTLNPVVKFLTQQPYEHRVISLPGQPFQPAQGMETFSGVYGIEWLQQLFPYYNIQSLDVVQRPRISSDIAAYETALAPRSYQTLYTLARMWQLTNTRYLLGATACSLPMGTVDTLSFLNDGFDPALHRFKIAQRFEIEPKPGITQPRQYSDLTATPKDDGRYAVYEFTGALPRVKLYSNWVVNTNDQTTLTTLASTNFDPTATLLVSSPVPVASPGSTNAGTVDFESYAPKHIVFKAQAASPAVLLLNDKYDEQWSVSVDGKPASLLRCNFIMRGVYLPPGQHTVEFSFSIPHQPMYFTLAAIVIGLGLCGFVFVASRRQED